MEKKNHLSSYLRRKFFNINLTGLTMVQTKNTEYKTEIEFPVTSLKDIRAGVISDHDLVIRLPLGKFH